MYNCLQKIKAHFSPKLLVVLTMFMMICGGAWAETYYWVGEATTPEGNPDNSWNNPVNWSIDGTTLQDSTGNSPFSGDKAIFTSNAAVTIDTDTTVDDIEITGATVSFSTETSNKLTIINSLSTNTGATLSINCASDFSSKTITNNGTLTFSASPILNSATITNEGTLTFSASPTFDESSKLTNSTTGKTYFLCSVDLSSVASADFTNSGTVYFYNNSDNLYTFKTPENCNLGNFYFLGKLEIIIDGNNCRATNFKMEIDSDTSSYFATDDFKVILSGTGTLKATNVNLTRASKTAGKTGTFEIGKDSSNTKFEISDSIETHSGVILQINEGATLETEKYAHNAGNADVIAKTIINGTFIANTSFDTAISISANAGSTEVTIGTDGVLTSPNIQPTTTTYRNTTASTIPFTNNGTINTKTFNIPYNVVNNGIINTNATPATITALSFSGTDGTINLKSAETTLTATSTTDISSQKEIKLTNTEATIKGNYSLTNFTATAATSMSGKSITLENAAITANYISLSGSAGSLLTLEGSGSAHSFETSSLTAEYLSIDENIILLNYSTAIAHCEPYDGDTTANWLKVIQNGWAIKALKTFTFTWTGDTDSIWNKDSNWDTGLIPEEDCKIIIPAGCDNYPVLGSDTYSGGTLTLSDTTSKITLGTADLSLSGKENEATASTTLSNAGTIVFTGNGRITDGTDAINDVSHGTVEYAGTGGSVNDFGTTDYNNLIISGTNWQIDGDCTVQNSFSIADGGTCKISTATSITAESITIADGGSCSVSAETNLKAKTFAFYGSGTNKNLTSSANVNMIFIPATANADVNIPSGIDSSFSFESTGTLHLENESTGKLVFSDSYTFNVFEYKLNFHSPVILKQDIKVQNSVTAAESITAGDTSGISALIFQGSGEIELNPTTDKTYQNITINDTGCSLTVNNNGYTITNCTITKATSTTFDGTPAITNLSDDTTAGNITFNNGANITNTVSLKTTGKTTVKGNIIAASFSAKNLVAGADAAINTTGAQTYGTINGTTAEAQDLTLTASAVTINDNVGTTRRLDILTINAPLTIGTTGKQISAKEIDFAGDISGSDKNLTITTAKLKSTIAADGTSAITLNQLTLSQATTIGTENASTLSLNISKIPGTSTLTFDENATQINLKDGIEINPNIINKRNVICNGAATFNGTFTNTSGSLTGDQTTGNTLTFKKKYSGTGATLIAAKATNATNGITIFQADVDLSDTTFNASSGTVILSGATAPASQLLTTKNDGTTAFNKLTINGNVTFATSNTIDTLTANNLGDKTLSFYDNTTQTVTTLSLTGTNKDHKLTLTSTGHWNISCTNEPELKFLIVDNSTNSTPGTPAPGTNFVAFDSIDGGSNVYWNFPDMEYKWTGTTSSDWRTASNWYPTSIPGIGSKIIIQPADNYPILDFELILSGNNSTAVITVEENAIFDIADNSLTLGLSDGVTITPGTITNKGTVIITGVNSQSINYTTMENSGDDSTVIYSGTSPTVNFIWDGDNSTSKKDYKNLQISNIVNATADLNISRNLTINKNISLLTGSISVSGETTIQTDCTTVNTSGNQTYSDSVTISTAGSGVSINSTTGNLLFADTVTGTKLTVSGNTIKFSRVVGTTTTPLGQLSIDTATTTTFDESVYISTFTDSDTGNSGAITFSKGGIISNDVSLNTTGNVSIDGSTTEMSFNRDFSHTTGTTSITGTVTSAGTVSLGAADKLTTISSAEINAASLNCDILKISGDVTIETSGTQIETSGTQTYNGTINASTADSDTLTLKSTGQITFNGNIGSVIPLLKSLTTTTGSPVLINCASIKSSISQEYNGAVTLGTTLSSHTITSSTITFGTDATINGNASLVLEGTTSTTFNASIGNTTPLTSIEIKGPAIINCSDITTSDTQVFNDIVTLKHSVILSSDSTVIFKDNVSNSDEASTATLTVNANTEIDASSVTIKTSEFDFSGNITGSEADTVLTLLTPTLISTAISSSDIKLAKLIINQDTILKTSNASALYVYVSEINNSGKILIIDTSVSNFEFKQACIINTDIQIYDGSKLTAWTGITTFTGNLTISGDFAHNNGTIKFAGTTQTLTTKDDGSTNFYNILISSPAKVTTASSFIVSGTSWDNTSEENGFTATAGTITFNNATVPASAPLTTVSGKNIFYDVACKTTDQNITFEEENIFSHEVTIGESANIPNNVIISSASAITFAPELYCQNITINAGENAVTFTDDSYFNTSFTNHGTGLVTFEGSATYGTSFINESPALTTFKSSFTGTGNAEFAGDINLTDDADRFFSAGAGHSITTTNNLIVNTNSVNTIQMNSTPTSKVIAKNFVLYSGKLKLNGTLESTGDIILLGPDYTTLDSQTGIDGIYLYNQTRPSPVNYTTAFIAAPYNGEVTALENAVIKADKNFYSNGIILAGPASGSFEIQLPKTSDSHKGFAEAVKTTVNNCNVRCWELPSNTATDDTAPAKIAAYECTDNSNNTNWNFEDFEILNAWTERDDAIFVEFNSPVRNLYNEITNSLPYLTYQGSTDTRTAFAGIYTKPDCQNADLIENIDIELTNGRYSIFLKAPDSWNTDATGTSAGSSALSSDRNGNHKTSVPYLDIPRSLTGVNYIITNKWGKRLNNYSTRPPTPGKSYGTNETAGSETYVLDKTGPVLWSVRTGQELHTAYNSAIGESCQHSYDSHNFLEFRYSEPVEFNSNSIPADSENIQVTDTFGAISGNAGFTTATNTLIFAGIARLTAPSANQLLLNTGSQGSANKYMNALYRTDEYSLRLSIAGWTDGTVSDYSGNEYKNWKGYIDEAKPFTGAQVFPIDTTNNLVTDLQGNLQIEYEANKVEPLIISNSIDENPSHLLPVSPDVYSAWDISEPVFAPLRLNSETTWTETKNADTSEAIGNTNGSGSTLDRIDFHFFDNTPAYSSSDTAEWFTESGWCTPSTAGGKENLYDNTYTYAADIIGGARQFDSVQARRTSGGIRLSTKLNAAAGFKYSTDIDETNPSTAFATGLSNIHTTVISQLFTGASEPQHSANDPDGLYLGIGITDTDLPVETSFAFSYNYSNAFLTDLAGNRLRNKTISKTIDRTPPSFDIILSPVNQKQIYIVFVKKISSKIEFRNPDGSPNEISENTSSEVFLNMLPSCFQIITINSDGSYAPSTDIEIDTSIPAKIVEQYSDSHFTCISMTLTKEICFEDIKNLHIQLKNHPDFPETSPDIYTNNNNAKVTFIQDELGNYMQMYSAHALSDFAIGLVNPLYAYSSDINENDEPVMNGLYEQGSWAVHDWDADQKNYGTLPNTHAVTIIASEEDGTEDNSQIPENVRLYLSDSPDAGSVSTQFNKDFKTSLRVWLPDLTDGIFRALSAKNNSNFTYVDSSLLNEEEPAEGLIFDIPVEMINRWKNGDQISFIFGITESDGSPVSIFNSPYYDNEQRRYNYALSSKVPLYSLRMHDITDIGTLDLWSFRLKSETAQRGGVTILNNVIDAGKGEKTVVKISLPDEGRLNVIVMTLDGNIITYLNRGNTKAGEHYFTWDGKNRNGKPVARGMYFVRVIGSGIDETRKVMVVK